MHFHRVSSGKEPLGIHDASGDVVGDVWVKLGASLGLRHSERGKFRLRLPVAPGPLLIAPHMRRPRPGTALLLDGLELPLSFVGGFFG